MKLVDTNIILRFLTRDDRKKAEKCYRLFQRAVKGEEELFISDLAIAETIWVLEKAYKLSKSDIRQKIEAILNTQNLIFQNLEILEEAIVLYDAYDIDFIDTYHVILAGKLEMKTIFSYDRDFDKFEEVNRKEP